MNLRSHVPSKAGTAAHRRRGTSTGTWCAFLPELEFRLTVVLQGLATCCRALHWPQARRPCAPCCHTPRSCSRTEKRKVCCANCRLLLRSTMSQARLRSVLRSRAYGQAVLRVPVSNSSHCRGRVVLFGSVSIATSAPELRLFLIAFACGAAAAILALSRLSTSACLKEIPDSRCDCSFVLGYWPSHSDPFAMHLLSGLDNCICNATCGTLTTSDFRLTSRLRLEMHVLIQTCSNRHHRE